MLLIVIVLFLLTELPQAVLIILSMALEGFFEHVYIPLGDAMDILALVNNAINFVLYCSMSRKFRRSLWKLIGCKNQSRDMSCDVLQMECSKQVTQCTFLGSK